MAVALERTFDFRALCVRSTIVRRVVGVTLVDVDATAAGVAIVSTISWAAGTLKPTAKVGTRCVCMAGRRTVAAFIVVQARRRVRGDVARFGAVTRFAQALVAAVGIRARRCFQVARIEFRERALVFIKANASVARVDVAGLADTLETGGLVGARGTFVAWC